MSEISTSEDTLNFTIIDNNKSVSIDFASSIESNITIHNNLDDSHPKILNQINQFSENTNTRLDGYDSSISNMETDISTLQTAVATNKFGDVNTVFSVATPYSESHAANKAYVDSYLSLADGVIGLGVVNNSTTFTILPGGCLDSTLQKKLSISSAMTKSLTVFAAGNAYGSLESAISLASKTLYLYMIADSDLNCDFLLSQSSSSPILPSGYTYYRQIGVIYFNSSSTITSCYPGKDIQSSYSLNQLAFSDLKNLTSTAASNIISAGIRTITSSYISGSSWYRIWSDGFKEQGGSGTLNAASATSITFLVAFSNTNYNVNLTISTTAVSTTAKGIYERYDVRSTSGIYAYASSGSEYLAIGYNWVARGY